MLSHPVILLPGTLLCACCPAGPLLLPCTRVCCEACHAGWVSGQVSLSTSVSSCHLAQLHLPTRWCLTYQVHPGATQSREPSCQRQGRPATGHWCPVLGESRSGWEDADGCQRLVLRLGVRVYVIVVAEEAPGGYFGQTAAGRWPPNHDGATAVRLAGHVRSEASGYVGLGSLEVGTWGVALQLLYPGYGCRPG